jgi:type I restriction enzyme S subunit
MLPDRVDPRYALYFYKSEYVRQTLDARVESVTRSHQRADPDQILKIWTCFPPLDEQRAIAAFLDRETAKIDSLIKKKQKLSSILKEKTWGIIRAEVFGYQYSDRTECTGVDWIPNVPIHWSIARLKRFIQTMDYGLSEAAQEDGQIRMIGMGHIQDGRIINAENANRLNSVDRQMFLRDGDILFNRTNSLDLVGKSAVYEGDEVDCVTFASYLVRFRTTAEVNPYFLAAYMNLPEVLEYARSIALPSIGQANLNPNRYRTLPVPVPPRAEQDKAVERIGNAREKSDRISRLLARQINHLREYRAALISAAVTGQIDVRGQG